MWGVYGEFGVVSRWLTATVESTLVRDNAQAGAHTNGIGDWRLGAWTGVIDAAGAAVAGRDRNGASR